MHAHEGTRLTDVALVPAQLPEPESTTADIFTLEIFRTRRQIDGHANATVYTAVGARVL